MLRTLFLLKVRSDAVQVVGEHAQSDVTLVSLLAFVGTAVESMLFKGVDITFNRAVSVCEFAPFFAALTLTVRLAELAFFGHDDHWNFQLKELAVFDTAKSAIKADTF